MPLADLEFVAILLSLPPKCWITGMGGGAARTLFLLFS